MNTNTQSMNRMTERVYRPHPHHHTTVRTTPTESGLVRWVSMALLGLFIFLVLVPTLTPVFASLNTTVAQVAAVKVRVAVPEEVQTPYGVCADLCTSDGACRHVVVPSGWHRGQRVSNADILAAASCH